MGELIAPSTLERLLRRDRAVTLVALLAGSALAWAYILAGAGMSMTSMQSMPGMDMPMAWTPADVAILLVMWGAMMVAMMLPSAAPMILFFATVERRRRDSPPLAATARFAGGYVVVWIGFSIAAVLLQWLLDQVALLSPAMATTNAVVAGAVLVAAGIYQFTPFKQACLRSCQSPLEFVSRYWTNGPFGMGLRHGAYCVGCCWMVMMLLFVGGIMNLIWVVLIAAFVLVEKAAPRGQWVGYGVGVLLIGWGLWVLASHIVESLA